MSLRAKAFGFQVLTGGVDLAPVLTNHVDRHAPDSLARLGALSGRVGSLTSLDSLVAAAVSSPLPSRQASATLPSVNLAPGIHGGQGCAPVLLWRGDARVVFVGPAPGATAAWVKLNVGGHIVQTSRDTLTRFPDSMLGALFLSEHWHRWFRRGACVARGA